MLNITRATTHIFEGTRHVSWAKCRGHNFFRGYMDPGKFRQLSILKAQSRPRFPVNCLKVILQTNP